MHPKILDINNKLIAILDKSFKVGYEKIKNGLWRAQFTLPLKDPKNQHVKPKYFVEIWDHDRRIGLFVVNPKRTIKNESTQEITYHCEHVKSTLHSDVLFGYHQWSNFETEEVLQGLLDMQETKHWVLGEVAFKRFFHYGWENEDSLLNAIMSVPKPFDVPYLWTWDDSVYPFVLNLVEPSDAPKDIIASGHNLKGIEVEEDPTDIITRIYPLGAGEGVNQLTIAEVNNGIPYLEDVDALAEYGLHKRIWVDMRFTNPESLMASGQAILDKYKKPLRSIAIDCRDYTLFERERKKKLMALYNVGDVLKVHDQDTNTHEDIRVEKITKRDIYGAPDDLQLELGNVFEDISTTFSELQKKQLVNETYSQGATNIDSRDFADNCDQNFPAVIRFPIPDDVVNINEMTLTFETQPYRAYSKAIEGGGSAVASTQAGGGVVESTSNGGGGIVTSGDSGIDVISGWDETAEADGHTHAYWRVFGHKHNINLPSHSHAISIPNHNHVLILPNHTHGIHHGIFEYDTLPTEVAIEVDGTTLDWKDVSGENIDLAPYLRKTDGRIDRGRYAEIVIRPNGLARINATVTSRLFIQSHVGTVM